jgi:hypothetical protein
MASNDNPFASLFAYLTDKIFTILVVSKHQQAKEQKKSKKIPVKPCGFYGEDCSFFIDKPISSQL